MSRNLGFTMPFILIFISVFVSVPVLFWFLNPTNSTNGNIQGASSTNLNNDFNGVRLRVSSQKSTWSLSTYLCTSLEECTKSLTSGKDAGVISGDAVDEDIIEIERGQDWGNYKYLKVFAKSGLSDGSNNFKAALSSESNGLYIKDIESSGTSYEVGVISLDENSNNKEILLEFKVE